MSAMFLSEFRSKLKHRSAEQSSQNSDLRAFSITQSRRGLGESSRLGPPGLLLLAAVLSWSCAPDISEVDLEGRPPPRMAEIRSLLLVDADSPFDAIFWIPQEQPTAFNEQTPASVSTWREFPVGEVSGALQSEGCVLGGAPFLLAEDRRYTALVYGRSRFLGKDGLENESEEGSGGDSNQTCPGLAASAEDQQSASGESLPEDNENTPNPSAPSLTMLWVEEPEFAAESGIINLRLLNGAASLEILAAQLLIWISEETEAEDDDANGSAPPPFAPSETDPDALSVELSIPNELGTYSGSKGIEISEILSTFGKSEEDATSARPFLATLKLETKSSVLSFPGIELEAGKPYTLALSEGPEEAPFLLLVVDEEASLGSLLDGVILEESGENHQEDE